MQKFERSDEAPPRYLQSEVANQARAALRDYFAGDALKRAQSRVPASRVNLDDHEIIGSLNRLFKAKCAFCEARTEIGAYRFRPPSEALPARADDSAHLYYAWLGEAWENIYAICKSCRPEQPTKFEVFGKRAGLPAPSDIESYASEGVGLWRKERGYPPDERPHLLDPCVQLDFVSHFQPLFDGNLIALTPRAAATIAHFNLDTPERTAQRRARYQEYLGMLLEALSPPDHVTPAGRSGVFDFTSLEFGGTWFLLLRRIATRLAKDEAKQPTLSIRQIAAYMLRHYRAPGIVSRIDAIISQLAREDSHPVATPADPVRRHSHARLQSVSFRNFKALESLDLKMPVPADNTDDPASSSNGALLILGENAAGKSSILEGIALTLCGAEARRQLILKPAGFILNPAYMGATRPSPAARAASVTLRFAGDISAVLHIDADGMSDNEPSITPVFAYGAFRHYNEGRRNYSAAKPVMTLFKSEILLSNPEEWLLGLDNAPFNMVIRALRDILSIEGEFDVIERNATGTGCVIVTSHGEGGALLQRTPLSVASSGFRAVLAMVCDIMHGLMDERINPGFQSFNSARGIVLIDEIEAHLHPRWKMQIMRGIRKALPEITFIASSHDPLCLRGMEDGEVVVLHRVPRARRRSGQMPIFVEQLTALPDSSRLTVEQLLTSDFFSMFSTDAPQIEQSFATIADILADRRAGRALTVAQTEQLQAFEREVGQALPVGSTIVQQIVQEAVADFLKLRRTATDQKMRALRTETKSRIIAALGRS